MCLIWLLIFIPKFFLSGMSLGVAARMDIKKKVRFNEIRLHAQKV